MGGFHVCRHTENWIISLLSLIITIFRLTEQLTEVNSPYPIDKKFEAFNFHVINIDGNDFDQIDAAFKEAKTVKGHADSYYC